MTPYTKQIVELHKIHKAIENCGCNKDDGQGGGDTPTEVYIKFRAENFGIRNADYVPDTVDKSKGYSLDEIFDISGEVLERFIKCQEDALNALLLDDYSLQECTNEFSVCYYFNENAGDNAFQQFKYISYESGNIGSRDGAYPEITTAFIKYDDQSGEYSAKTFIAVHGTNFKDYSWIPPLIVFGKNDEDGKWYIVHAR